MPSHLSRCRCCSALPFVPRQPPSPQSPCHRLEVGIEREVQEREETHAVMFTGLQEKLKAAAAAVEADAETSITDRFEPGLAEHVGLFLF